MNSHKCQSKNRKFCSTACKIQWHNKNEAVSKGKIIAICKKCGREFYAFPSKQRKYCSRECYDKMRCENDNEDYEKICEYKRTMIISDRLLSQGIISAEDYRKIDKTIADKYEVNSCSMYVTVQN